jgi:hypothetical protein
LVAERRLLADEFEDLGAQVAAAGALRGVFTAGFGVDDAQRGKGFGGCDAVVAFLSL